MTKQETFDKVVTFLRLQDCRSEEDGECRYKKVVGGRILRCAAGCLIPDEDYQEEWEGQGVFANPNTGPSQYFRDKGYDTQLISDLQDVHDDYDEDIHYSFAQYIEDKFQIVAREHSLVYSAPN